MRLSMTIPEEKAETATPLAVRDTSLAYVARMSRAIADTARRTRFSTRAYRVGYAGGFRARRGERAFRLGIGLSFLFLVAVPAIVTAAYFSFFASPEYVTEIRFTLGGGEMARTGDGNAFRGLPLALVVQDTEVVANYLRSPTVVAQMAQILRPAYGNSNVDWLSRLPQDASREELQRYWRSMTSSNVKVLGGIVNFTVDAYTPQDAAQLGSAVLALSEKMINDLNDRMLHDSLQRANDNLNDAAKRVAGARIKLEQARNAEGMLSAGGTANAIADLLKNVEAGRIALRQEYDSRLRFVARSQPEMRALRAQMRAADTQIAQLKSRITVTDLSGRQNVVSASMVKLSALDLDRQIAEMEYSMASTALEQARLIAKSKLVYLNSFVTPMLGERPDFPTPTEKIIIEIAASLALWGALVAVAKLVRNNMA